MCINTPRSKPDIKKKTVLHVDEGYKKECVLALNFLPPSYEANNAYSRLQTGATWGRGK